MHTLRLSYDVNFNSTPKWDSRYHIITFTKEKEIIVDVSNWAVAKGFIVFIYAHAALIIIRRWYTNICKSSHQPSLVFLFKWVLRWRLKFPFWMNRFPQTLHFKGFSPVWVRSWSRSVSLLLNFLLQNLQYCKFCPVCSFLCLFRLFRVQ